MTPNYWLDPVRPADIVRALVLTLAGDASVAIEGDAKALGSLGAATMPGARVGPAEPFRPEYGGGAQMIILPLENEHDAAELHRLLAAGTRVRPEIRAIQIQRHGRVEFVAGDSFHRECVSVGAGVAEELLDGLVLSGAIAGFYSPAEARKHFLGGLA